MFQVVQGQLKTHLVQHALVLGVFGAQFTLQGAVTDVERIRNLLLVGRAIGKPFDFTDLGEVDLKGFDDPVPVAMVGWGG